MILISQRRKYLLRISYQLLYALFECRLLILWRSKCVNFRRIATSRPEANPAGLCNWIFGLSFLQRLQLCEWSISYRHSTVRIGARLCEQHCSSSLYCTHCLGAGGRLSLNMCSIVCKHRVGAGACLQPCNFSPYCRHQAGAGGC